MGKSTRCCYRRPFFFPFFFLLQLFALLVLCPLLLPPPDDVLARAPCVTVSCTASLAEGNSKRDLLLCTATGL